MLLSSFAVEIIEAYLELIFVVSFDNQCGIYQIPDDFTIWWGESDGFANCLIALCDVV